MNGSRYIPASRKGAKSARFGRKSGTATPPEGEQLTKEGLKTMILEAVQKGVPNDLLTEAKAKALITSILDERIAEADEDKPITAKAAKAITTEAMKQVQAAAEEAKEIADRKEKAAAKKKKAAKAAGDDDEETGDDDDGEEGDDDELSDKEKNAAIEAAKAAKKKAKAAKSTEEQALTVKGATELMEGMFNTMLEKMQLPGRKQHGGEDDDLHVYLEDGERSGNLSLHKKQLLNVCLRKEMNEGIRDSDLKVARAKGARDMDRLAATRYAGGYKALTVAGVGSGNELVPSDLSSQLYRRIYLESPLAQYMLAREIQMPTDNYTFPLRTTRPKFYHRGNSVAAIESTPGTAEFTLSARKLMAKVSFEYELEEDSIVPVLPMILDDLGAAAAEAWESSIVNGDTTATHQDSDTNAITGAPEKAYVGLRKMALAGNLKVSFASGGIDQANTTVQRKMLKKYGRNPRDMVWLCGIQGYNDMLNLPEVFSLDKFGQRATVQTGELFFYKGVQIMLCSGIREDLNASGVYDGTTTTKGSFMLANLSHFITGRRRDFTMEMDKDISNQTKWLVASFRKAFSTIETPDLTGGITPISLGYNYTA